MEGYGLKKKRRIVKRGMEEGVNDAKKSKETVMKKVINGKYIDLNKLKNNIICIRYCKTRALVPNVKVVNDWVSPRVKTLEPCAPGR